MRPVETILISYLIASSGCSCGLDVAQRNPQGLISGHAELKCEYEDGDNTTESFSYELPEQMQPETAFQTLKEQVQRTGALIGSAVPQACFRVVKATTTELLMVCEQANGDAPEAWHFLLEGRRIQAITGPARHILQWANP